MYQTSKKQAKVIQACLKPSCKVQLKKDGAEAARVDTPGWTNVRGWTSLDTPQVSTSGRLFLALCHSGFRHGLENWFPRVNLLVATELAYSVLFCSCVCFCLYGPFNCISFHKFSRQLSAFSICFFFGLNSAVLVLSTIHLFMKVSPSLDIILSG